MKNASMPVSGNAPVAQSSRVTLLGQLAERYNTSPTSLYATLKQTVFKGASDEEMQALCIVAHTYDLNPFTREIYAFPAKGGGIVPVVGVDGYLKVMNSNPMFDGIDFVYSETIATGINIKKPCPEWIEARIYRKDRTRPIVIREYLDECFRNTNPWQEQPRRMLRHKVIAQSVRVAFGFGGLYDEDDARVIAAENVDVQPQQNTAGKLNAIITNASNIEKVEESARINNETGEVIE